MSRTRLKKRKLQREEASEEFYRVPSLNSFIDDEDDYAEDMDIDMILEEKLTEKEKKEFSEIRKDMKNDIPTIRKILNSNITRYEKKLCLRYLDQLMNMDDSSEDYFRIIDKVNEILSKGKFYSKQEILKLEKEEENLRSMYVSNDTLKTKILKLEADSSIKARLLSMYEEMLTYPTDSSTYSSLKEEIEWSIKLPYQKREVEDYVNMNNKDLNAFYCKVRSIMDQELYGMCKIKDRILHVLNDRRSSGDACGRNIALVGKPGTGKTQICKVLAKILDKKFAKISAGALDSAAIKGSNKVWNSSEPSVVLQTLASLKTNNAIIMFDEVDKLGDTPQGKVAQHALLHVSDPSDNKDFQDNYLKNFSHDLSKILFIYCMNDDECLDSALKDRLDIIYVDEYNNYEKLQIFKNYMLPKALENIGMNKDDVIIKDSAIKKLLDGKNLGLRNIEKIIKNIIEKINMYKSVMLSDGTLGNLNLPYSIPNFKLPLKIDYKLLAELM